MNQSKKIEILHKPYSKDIRGYIFRIRDFIYIVINKCLPKGEAIKAEATLKEVAASHPPSTFILLKGDGQLYKSEDFDINILERAC